MTDNHWMLVGNEMVTLGRFLEKLPETARDYARETVQLRHDLQANMRLLLDEEDSAKADVMASWVRMNVVRITFRWHALVEMYRRRTGATPPPTEAEG